MIRKVATIAISAIFALSLCACGGGGGAQPNSGDQSTDQATSAPAETTPAAEPEELKYSVDSPIDLTIEGGTLKFVRIEKANENLTDYDNALLFVFEFTNNTDTPADSQMVFWADFYQNGTELKCDYPYYSSGGDQYDLVGSFFSTALKGGTVTYARIVVPKDDSPITVYAHPNGLRDESNSQYMEVTFGDAAETTASADGIPADSAPAAPSFTVEDVDTALQGSWGLDATNVFTFDQGKVKLNAGVQLINGTYVIDTEASKVLCTLQATDGTVDVGIPFTFDGGVLRLFNTEGGELTRQETPEQMTVYSVGETFSNSALGIEFLSFEIVDEIYPSDTSGYYTYCTDQDGHSYLLATCRFTNNGSDYGVPGLASAAAFSVDGNRYNASIEVDDYDRFASNYRVEAKDTDLIYVYASVPDSVLGTSDIYLFWHVPKDAKDLQYYYSGNSDDYEMVILQMPK